MTGLEKFPYDPGVAVDVGAPEVDVDTEVVDVDTEVVDVLDAVELVEVHGIH
jgi:hypothetical protein